MKWRVHFFTKLIFTFIKIPILKAIIQMNSMLWSIRKFQLKSIRLNAFLSLFLTSWDVIKAKACNSRLSRKASWFWHVFYTNVTVKTSVAIKTLASDNEDEKQSPIFAENLALLAYTNKTQTEANIKSFQFLHRNALVCIQRATSKHHSIAKSLTFYNVVVCFADYRGKQIKNEN